MKKMNKSRMKPQMAALTTLAALAAGAAEPAAPPASPAPAAFKAAGIEEMIQNFFLAVPLRRLDKQDVFCVETTLEGKSAWMQLDSGAEGALIFDKKLGEAAGIALAEAGSAAGAAGAGQLTLYAGELKQFQVGPMAVQNQKVCFLDFSKIPPLTVGGEAHARGGQIGAGFLRSARAIIDYTQDRMIIPKPGVNIRGGIAGAYEQLGQPSVPLALDGDRYYVRATLAGKPVMFLCDTGTGPMTLRLDYAKSVGAKLSERQDSIVVLDSGTTSASTTTLPQLQVGPVTVPNAPFLVLDDPRPAKTVDGLPVVGILGGQFFQPTSAILDFGAGRMIFAKAKAMQPPARPEETATVPAEGGWHGIAPLAKADFSAAKKRDTVYSRLVDKDAATPEERLRQALVMEQWEEIFKIVAEQPAEEQPAVARMLLESIRNGQPWQASQKGQEGMRNTGLAEFLRLARLLPAPAADEDTQRLGSILRDWLAGNSTAQKQVQDELLKGIAGWGGTGNAGLKAAVSLLDLCNQPAMQLAFLPEIKPADVKTPVDLELMSRRWNALWATALVTNMAPRYLECWAMASQLETLEMLSEKQRFDLLCRQILCLSYLDEKEAKAWLAKQMQDPKREKAVVDIVLEMEGEKKKLNAEMRDNLIHLNALLLDALYQREKSAPGGRGILLSQLIQYWQDDLAQSLAQQSERQRNENENRYNYGNKEKTPLRYSDPSIQFAPAQSTVQSLSPDSAIIASLEKADQVAVYTNRLQMVLAQEVQASGDFAEAIDILRQIAKMDPVAGTAAAKQVLTSCTSSFDPDSADPQMARERQMMMRYAAMGMGIQAPVGIPMTRARQERNLALLKKVLGQLRDIPGIQMPSDLAVGAFVACYSQAEVYRYEDIETVFQPLDQMPVDQVFQVADRMRQMLAKTWQDPKVQEEAKTNRSQAEMLAEVARGYDDLKKFMDRADPDGRRQDWLLTLFRGVIRYERAEFNFANGCKLEEYAGQRDAAFQAMSQGCGIYVELFKQGKIAEASERPWMMWFNAAMQSSSLAVPRPKIDDKGHTAENVESQLSQIRTSLRQLPDGAYLQHRNRLAEALYGQAIGAGDGKVLWLQRTFELVRNRGDLLPDRERTESQTAEAKALALAKEPAKADDSQPNPVADRINGLLSFYEELKGEIEVTLVVDGSTSVRPGEDFGLLVAVDSTRQIVREGSGFGRYLANISQNYGQKGRPYLDNMNKAIRAALEKNFEISSVTFLDPAVQARPIPGRQGWLRTPLAYVQLAPKGKEIDRIPSVKLEFDFLDRAGPLVLPVVSAVTRIKVEEQAPARPCADLEVTQIFDQRPLSDDKKGNVLLEIVATGKGIVPNLDTLIGAKAAAELKDKATWQGFTVVAPPAAAELGSRVNVVEASDSGTWARSERSWKIELKAEHPGTLPKTFAFPAVAVAGAKTVCKQYRDADQVETPPVVVLEVPGRNRLLAFAIKAVLAIVFMLGAFVFWRRSLAGDDLPEAAGAFGMPAALTPFSVIHLLEQIRASGKLPEEMAALLNAEIQELEKRHFAPGASTASDEASLRSICETWIDRANNA